MDFGKYWSRIECFGFYSFAASVFCLPIQTLGHINFFGETILLFDVCITLSAFAFVLHLPHRISHNPKALINRFTLVLLVFFLAMCTSAIFSEDQKFSTFRLIRVGHVVMIAAISCYFLTNFSRIERVLTIWLVSAGITVVLGLVGIILFYMGVKYIDGNIFIRDYGSLPPGNYPRIACFFRGINKCCGYLTITSALVWYRWLSNPYQKRFVLLLSGLVVVAIFTFSPGLGGFFLVIGCSVAWLPVKNLNLFNNVIVRKGGFALGIIAAVVFLIAAVLSPLDIMNGKFTASPRLLTMAGALQTIGKYPILGLGLGLTGIDVQYYCASGYTQYLASAHNTILSIGAQTGICGITVLLLIVIYLFSHSRETKDQQISLAEIVSEKEILHNQENLNQLYLILKIAVVGGFLYHGLIQSTEWFRYQWTIWGMLAAVKFLSYKTDELCGNT